MSLQREPCEPREPREPRYYRLKRHLTELTRTLEPGSAVPTERDLAVQFGTSRTTVRQALHELVVEGRLERVQGRGTFVAKAKVAQNLELTSYTEDLRSQGLDPTSRLVTMEYVRAAGDVPSRLAVTPGARVIHLVRLRLVGGEPMAIERSFLEAARFPGLRRHLARLGSLYAALDEGYGVRLGRAEETIETALASPEEAALLGVDTGLALLLLSRHGFDLDGRPVEWGRSVYRGD
ncbi:MAG TPA: GntR family transcriptional regulator, partial [Actinomycetes bacterium]